METEDVVLYYSCKREVVEKRGEILPYVGVSVLPETLVVESVNLSDLFAFMVSSQNGDPVWVSHLESHKESDCLD
jgi:hypothetical protein